MGVSKTVAVHHASSRAHRPSRAPAAETTFTGDAVLRCAQRIGLRRVFFAILAPRRVRATAVATCCRCRHDCGERERAAAGLNPSRPDDPGPACARARARAIHGRHFLGRRSAPEGPIRARRNQSAFGRSGLSRIEPCIANERRVAVRVAIGMSSIAIGIKIRPEAPIREIRRIFVGPGARTRPGRRVVPLVCGAGRALRVHACCCRARSGPAGQARF